MKRIAILTRKSEYNYGTLLQNYALQEAIFSLGEKRVMTVDDRRLKKDYFERINPHHHKTTVKHKLYKRLDAFKAKYIGYQFRPLTKKLFLRFQKKYIRYYRAKSTDGINQKFDVIISGSDQIWAQAAEPLLYPFYMQDFADSDKVKATYAVSVGSDYSPENTEKVKGYLDRFDFLSVRESSSAEILRQYTDKEIVLSCDPVLLLPIADWEKLAGRRNIEQAYIFCFFLADHDWYYSKAAELLEEFPGRRVLFYSKKIKNLPDYQQIPDSSPEEFLNYIKYADYVLTDSYHAFLFSLIFHKNLSVFERFHNEANNFQNGRVHEIMERLKIDKKYVCKHDALNTDEIDYVIAKREMDLFREESLRYLERVLSFSKDSDSNEKVRTN